MDLSKYSSIHYDSRKIEAGSIFVAIKGEKFDANQYIDDVIEKGAKLIISENDLSSYTNNPKFKEQSIEFLQVENAREALAYYSDLFYGQASQKLSILAVTGTNGKTTVTHLLQGIFENCALLGTMGLKKEINLDYQDMGSTTPQSKEIHEIIKNLVDEDFKYLGMEVSSHALEQHRVTGIKFKSSVITNLTQDHLDYHLTMDNYFKAKAKIFSQTEKYAILNSDDDYYQAFKTEAEKQKLEIISFGLKQESNSIYAEDLKYTDHGLSYKLINNSSFDSENKTINISLKLNGLFNVYNSLAAIAVALSEGISLNTIKEKLEKNPVVAGRFEVVKEKNSPFCIIDYAHSPDGLLNVLKGTKELIENPDSKIYCVFGCGGDRDITKRPQMGKIAFDLADFSFITSDNPRSEEPDQIIADILAGIPDLSKTKVIVDRKQAIEEAIKTANAQDFVVVAGKGHENYQILKDQTINFDDKQEVSAALALYYPQ